MTSANRGDKKFRNVKNNFLQILDELEEFGIVKINRKFGKTKLYALDKENEIVQKLMELELFLIERYTEGLEKTKRKKELLLSA